MGPSRSLRDLRELLPNEQITAKVERRIKHCLAARLHGFFSASRTVCARHQILGWQIFVVTERAVHSGPSLSRRLPSTSYILLQLFCPLPLAEAHSGATAVLFDEFDAGKLKCPSEHSARLRLHTKPESYRFFLDAFAAWPRTVFVATDGLNAAAAFAERAAAALVRRTPG